MKLAGLKILSIMVAAAFVVIACTPSAVVGEPEKVAVNGGFYWDISSEQLNDMLQSKDFIMVNTHTPYYAELAETDLFIPADKVEESISLFPQDKGAKIVVYCQAGMHSAIAARKLVELGYTNIWNLKVGMVEWEDEGYPLLRNEAPGAADGM
jgi:rhodanese-related sulfurtransferase